MSLAGLRGLSMISILCTGMFSDADDDDGGSTGAGGAVSG